MQKQKWHCGGCLNKRAARLRLAVQAPAITTTEQSETQSAQERAFAAEPLGDPPLSPVRLYLSCNANVYRRYPYIGGFSLFSRPAVSESVGFTTESILSPTHAQSEKQCIISSVETEIKPTRKKNL